jgi:hypothetical protein
MTKHDALSMSMRTVFIVASGLVLLGAGCQLFKPLRNPDSLDNATSKTWAVTADFATGLHHTYDQGPESFSDFGTMTRGAIPVLTNLVAVSKSTPPVTYALSARQLSRLRRETQGGLTLVLYDDGIACLSPQIKKTLEEEILKRDYTREEYFRLLRAQQEAALTWTKGRLGRP